MVAIRIDGDAHGYNDCAVKRAATVVVANAAVMPFSLLHNHVLHDQNRLRCLFHVLFHALVNQLNSTLL